jgi:hypothetical protein
MKKLFLFLAVGLLCVSGLFAQKANDFFIYKSGHIVNCIILEVDSVENNLKYKLRKSSSIRFEPLDKILAFYIDKSEAKDGFNINNQGQNEDKLALGDIKLVDNQEIDLAGYQLLRFADNAQTGTSLMLVGTLMSVGSLILKDEFEILGVKIKSTENSRHTIAGIGLVVSTVGAIVQLVGYSNARNAGKLMQLNDRVSLNTTQDGIGLAMKIK